MMQIEICAKYVRFTSQMHPFFVFNTPCNVSLSYRLTSKILKKHTRFAKQILLNTPVLSCKYAKKFGNAPVLRLQYILHNVLLTFSLLYVANTPGHQFCCVNTP